MKKLIAVLLFLLCVPLVHAFRLESGKELVIRTPVREDLYVSGGTIEINAPVYGDLVITGGNITINDSVTGDILLAGGTAVFNGYVGDDIRCAGGKLYIHSSIAGDLVVAGGEVLVDTSATLGGLLATGGELRVFGTVKGKTQISGGKLDFNGRAENDADLRAEEMNIDGIVSGKTIISAEKLNLGPKAAFNREVRYWNKSGKVDFANRIKSGKAVYDPELARPYPRWEFLGFSSILGMLWYLGATLMVIVVLQYLFSRSFAKAGNEVINKPLKSLGYGFLFFLAIPVIAMLAFITVIGIPIGLLMIFLYIAAIIFSGALIVIACLCQEQVLT